MNNFKNSAKTLKQAGSIPQVFVELLKGRGVVGEEAVQKFLFPRLSDLRNPKEMKDLPAAARLVVDSIKSKQHIIIWGDYDVDGTTGTALLVNYFGEIGVDVTWHIPNRLSEGYGLNSEWFIRKRKEGGLGEEFLLITVDCGISNFKEIEVVKKIGGKVIVTDHHSLPEHAKPGCLVLNPSQLSCGFNGEKLAGVGVAFYLAAGIRAELSSSSDTKALAERLILKPYLAFVALGTLADLVDITTTNRILIRAGFEALSETPFIGLRELLTSCDILTGSVSSEDVGFLIGPRINAAGRLGESKIVVNLLIEQNQKKAKALAKKLTDLNIKRKRISDHNLDIALTKVSKALTESNKCAIVKGELHLGVAGIVASKLVETYGVPAIVFAKVEKPDGSIVYTGSARSIKDINIIELIKYCSRWLVRFGGHEMAAGLTVSEENFDGFEAEFVAAAKDFTGKKVLKPRKQYDEQCPVTILMDQEHLNYIQFLEPFGPGNSQPVFQDPAVKIIDSRTVGRNSEHLHVTIRGKQSSLKGIGFSLGERLNDIQSKPERKMIYTPTKNRFRGTVSWQVRVIDL